ncbi:PAS domain-containing sensor histidine kinase [Cupriavidus plantarum]|uniref:histidine kinase n=1 Tax=Cupriavidus plantarum TaxID=942865 RepID=A0A316EUY2_9BURK|nr:ATP-binding protein [Cupriavidus plantarum]NYI00558.1 PAS domain S-box-containing protein [Cupriavidus plantarum]PWK34968.1 PAS domain S-box-containing protein [Cupriavidus plantarum]REE93409.1 PAS domain S-box-containing protein [Cupriavidus plantarum]CAG2136927.1 Sensor histidine kinase RcsC [Cupriavidus plantarum]SMR84828.1 PAS domain S-box-containing protein [Cupriavidus plantarum]
MSSAFHDAGNEPRREGRGGDGAAHDQARASANDGALLPVDTAYLFEVLPDAYLILDGRNVVLHANAKYRAMTGRTLAEVVGRSVYDINQTGSAAQRAARAEWLDATLRDLAQGEERLSSLIRYDMTTDGSSAEHYWQVRVSRAPSPPAASSVAPGGLLLLQLMDVTNQVVTEEQTRREHAKLRSQARLRQVLVEEANEELRQNQARLDEVLAFARVGAWELDLATGYMVCTDQCKANMGLKPTDILNEARLFTELIHADDRERVRAAIDASVAARAHFEVEYRVVWADGSTHWLMSRGAGRHLGDGSAQSLIGFTIDITARKTSELRSQAYAAEQQRAREHSDRAVRAMDHFVAAVSHELRSPLHAILWWTTLLQRAKDMAHVERATEVIERNTHQLARMVDDLLDSGAIATGKLSVELRPLDLAALASVVAEDIRVGAESKGLVVRVESSTTAVVLGDESRMRQIVWNLLTNAVKFTDRGSIGLAVAIEASRAVLTVRDTGAGIETEALERIFERFEQARGEGTGRTAGLGLGLWMVKNLVQVHRGTVSAHSDGPGKGALFRVELPLATPDDIRRAAAQD